MFVVPYDTSSNMYHVPVRNTVIITNV